MTGSERTLDHSARVVAAGVAKKTAVLAAPGSIAVVAVQMTVWPDLPIWLIPAGVAFGAALGLANFRWLAYAVERAYLRQGATSMLANVAAAVITVLKLSTIFIVLFVGIKKQWIHLAGLMIGLTLNFGAILWQGYGLVNGTVHHHSDTDKN